MRIYGIEKVRPLFQRLKELDPATFEDLCFQILTARFPGIGLRQVEGKGGDKGADLFAGLLDGKPAIWQCKCFSDGIRARQKEKIIASLKTALKSFELSVWTLCIPIKLNITVHSWFQKLVKDYSGKVAIEVFDASMIVRELIFRNSIRSAFFPDAVLDVLEIKAALLGIAGYSDDQLNKLASETVEQYVERLRAKDPRFDYQVSYLTGTAGLEAAELSSDKLPKQTIATVVQGNRRLDVVVRDSEAILKDPPRINMTLSASGVEKLQRALRSGSTEDLGKSDLLGFKSSLDFLIPPDQFASIAELRVTPKFPTAPVSLRISFVREKDRVVYDLIDFTVTMRRDVFEFTSTSSHVPFRMKITLEPNSRSGKLGMAPEFNGREVRELDKLFDALKLLRADGGAEVELFDLRQQISLGSVHLELGPADEEQLEFERLIGELAEVATAFQQRFVVSDVIGQEDLQALAFLIDVCREGEVLGGLEDGLTATLVRRDEPAKNVLDLLAGEFVVGLENDNYPPVKLLGVDVPVGPCRLIIERTRVSDLEALRSNYGALAVGESI